MTLVAKPHAAAGAGSAFPSARILGMRVDSATYPSATARIVAWAAAGVPAVVCAANVHMVMEAYDEARFREIVNRADLVTADGMPLVWGLHRLGQPAATRVYGPDLTLAVLDAATREKIPVAFYGGSQEALDRLLQRVARDWPDLPVVAAISPPFRPLSTEEDAAYARQLRASGARLVFVGLGCPKQERWMHAQRDRIGAVLLGVGAAFDFLTGAKPQAPRWMMRAGLEWLFRLGSEPARLWRRYLILNPRFVALFALQLLFGRVPPGQDGKSSLSARQPRAR